MNIEKSPKQCGFVMRPLMHQPSSCKKPKLRIKFMSRIWLNIHIVNIDIEERKKLNLDITTVSTRFLLEDSSNIITLTYVRKFL